MRFKNLFGGFVCALFLICAVPAGAQDFKQIAPKPVPPAGTVAPEVTPPPQPPTGPNPDQVILPELKGLVLVDSPKKLARTAIGEGISIDNLPLADTPELRARLSPFLGKPATFRDLEKIAQIVTGWYQGRGHPFVDVAFPEQDINAGVVQAVVTEFHLGQLRAEGNRYFSSDLLLDRIRLKPGDPIDYPRLQEDLAWLNQNPFRRVSLVAEKSATEGDTDLVLKTDDEFPLRVYAGYDNTGTPALGRNRWNLGANWGNAFGLDQQLSYQLTTSDDFWSDPGNATFMAHSIFYAAPLPWRDKLNIFGSYSRVLPLLGPDLGLIGISGQASLRYVVTLPSLTLAGLLPGLPALTQDLQVGYDFKTSNNDLSFGGLEVSNVTTEVDQFSLIYDASLSGDYGQTSLSNTLVFSPGNLTAQNTDTLFQQQAETPFARARYVYDTLNIVQLTRLPLDASWMAKLTAQVSDVNLLPSEQLGAGGHDSVRGYDERAANGSVGFIVSQELRTPVFSLLGDLRANNWLPEGAADQAQLLAFWDYAQVRDAQHAAGAPLSTTLSSIGLGARYTIGRFADLRFDYGWQQRPLPGTTKTGEMMHVAATISY